MNRCQESISRWGSPPQRQRRLTKGWGTTSQHTRNAFNEWPTVDKSREPFQHYVPMRQRLVRPLRSRPGAATTGAPLESTFRKLADSWRQETQFISDSQERVLHPSYQSIIAMGPRVLPLVLKELESRRGHWFWALRFLANTDPVPENANIEGARQAWLSWGRQEGYLG